MSSTDTTRRSPATAICVVSISSVNSAIGSRNRYVRKTKPTRAPAVRPLSGPRQTPTPTTADTVNAENTSPDGKRNAPIRAARICELAVTSTDSLTCSDIVSPAPYALTVGPPDTSSAIAPNDWPLLWRALSYATSSRDWTARRTNTNGIATANATSASTQS